MYDFYFGQTDDDFWQTIPFEVKDHVLGKCGLGQWIEGDDHFVIFRPTDLTGEYFVVQVPIIVSGGEDTCGLPTAQALVSDPSFMNQLSGYIDMPDILTGLGDDVTSLKVTYLMWGSKMAATGIDEFEDGYFSYLLAIFLTNWEEHSDSIRSYYPRIQEFLSENVYPVLCDLGVVDDHVPVSLVLSESDLGSRFFLGLRFMAPPPSVDSFSFDETDFPIPEWSQLSRAMFAQTPFEEHVMYGFGIKPEGLVSYIVVFAFDLEEEAMKLMIAKELGVSPEDLDKIWEMMDQEPPDFFDEDQDEIQLDENWDFLDDLLD